MRRLLILVSAIVALVTTVPMAALGQEATPEPSTALPRTDTRYVIPFGPDGLIAGLTARQTLTGTCTADSITVSDRADAFNCLGEDSQFYDPCFENPFSPRDEPGEVACIPDPLSSEVVLLTVADPLPREKEALADQGQDPFAPWDLPWALELANGDRCTLLGGTLYQLAGPAAPWRRGPEQVCPARRVVHRRRSVRSMARLRLERVRVRRCRLLRLRWWWL